MAKVILKREEKEEDLIRRFKKLVLKEDIINECKKHQYFKSKALKRKEKSKEAQKRLKYKK